VSVGRSVESVEPVETVNNYDASEDIQLPGGGDVRDPYPHYEAMRAQCPVVSIGTIDHHLKRNTHLLVSRGAAFAAMEEDKLFSCSVSGDAMRDVMGRTILEMEGLEHRQHRKLVAHAFRPKAQEPWEASIVRPLVHELIDHFVERGRAELVKDLLYRYPIQVIARILGLPKEDSDQFQRWAISIIAHEADKDRGVQASQELEAYLRPILAARRAEPRDDVISDLVTARIDGEVLCDEEILPFLKLLMPAGGETTYRATGNLLFALLSHPDQLEALRADRSLLGGAVEEALRWEPPLQMTARTPHEPTVLEGAQLSPGDLLVVMLGSANHDPVLGEDLGSFDSTRAPTHHLTFGSGPHMCLGMHLARMEMRVAVDVLLERLPGLRLDPAAMAAQDPPHIHGSTFRSPTALPVVWDQ
jgi:cytochrome P450